MLERNYDADGRMSLAFKSLISPAELAAISENTQTRIVDCRFKLADIEAGRQAYLDGHIPNALYAHLDEDLSGPIIPGVTGRHPLPERKAFSKRLSSWGINNETQVVVYDDVGGAIASRLWWMLRWMGHEAVAVLDGGLKAWIAKDFTLESGQIESFAREFEMGDALAAVFDADDVGIKAGDGDWVVVDSRGATRYRGEEEPIDPVAGHIPGALNLPFAGNLDDDGFFLNSAELEARFKDVLKGTAADHAIFYCGSGVTAAHNLLAMFHCGLGTGALYPGSWSDWVTDSKRAVATGEA